ncbi:MAG: SixA phosphatase family protein [Henriciella sp.]
MKFGMALALIALSACAVVDSGSAPMAAAGETLEIYLVRHAEKQSGDDPALTEAGQARAERLAEILAGKGLTHIHSTPYRRTLATAAPIAEQTGIEVQLYDASDLAGFADQLRAMPGTHLVVGHSNTTPTLAAALGGDPGSGIDEKSEYDRLYVVRLSPEPPTSSIERFGVRYQAPTLETAD